MYEHTATRIKSILDEFVRTRKVLEEIGIVNVLYINHHMRVSFEEFLGERFLEYR